MNAARWVTIASSLAAFACAGSRQASSGLDHQNQIITEEEIVDSKAVNAYEAIRKLRGNFLSYRGRTTMMNTSSPEPTVYMDENAFGPLASLRTIPASQVAQIRLYRAWEAATKYGNGNMGGVIEVTTRSK